MKRNEWISDLLLKLGMVCIVLAVVISIVMKSAPFSLIGTADSAREQIVLLLESLQKADYEAMNNCLLPKQQIAGKDSYVSDVHRALYDAYIESIEYEFMGECYASDSALCQDIRVAVLDLSYILNELIDTYQRAYGVKIKLGENQQVYLEQKDGTLTDFFSSIPIEFVNKILSEKNYKKSMDITFETVYYQSQWRIALNADIFDLLTGGMTE